MLQSASKTPPRENPFSESIPTLILQMPSTKRVRWRPVWPAASPLKIDEKPLLKGESLR